MTQGEYLEFGDEGSTLGMEKRLPEPKYGITQECPVCHGYGGWHLKLHAYGEGRHFDGLCTQCNGRGYVQEGIDATCIHDLKEISPHEAESLGIKHYGMYWHVFICQKGCGKITSSDSSG